MSKIKETIYDTHEVDNLYKIVDKLVELRNDPFKYGDWTTYDPETKEERLAREKAENRNNKIDQVLG